MSRLVERDLACVWHPYAAPRLAPPPFPVARAEGVRLYLEDGRTLIDGMSSWWSAIHGYGHPALLRAAHEQLEAMSHVMFGGLTHEPAVALCERLLALAPGALARAFLCDSGSVAVEVALKMALQFWQASGRPRKQRLLTIHGGYHGDTFGAMAVCDPVGGMHTLFRGVLPQQLFAPRPACRFDEPCREEDIAPFEALIAAHAEELAAVILEPVVQGAGGMWFYSPGYLARVRELCDAHEVLLIADEIATGFGRAGRTFACEYAEVVPDILCLGKALTGGMLSLAATLASQRVCDGIASGEPGLLMHGPTFMGNPLACATALASLALLEAEPWQPRVKAIATQLAAELAPCRALPAVADVRVLGAIGVVELREPVDMAVVQPAFVEEGVWLRPFGRLVYTMPPYVTAKEDLSRVTGAIHAVVSKL